jgi:hypothetical protein
MALPTEIVGFFMVGRFNIMSLQVIDTMSLRQFLGYSEGDVMRSDCKPCSRLMRHTAGIFSVGGALGFWVLCRMHYGSFYFLPLLLFCSTCMSVSYIQATAFESSVLVYKCPIHPPVTIISKTFHFRFIH